MYLFFNEYLYRQIRVSNMCYDYLMLIIDISEYLLWYNEYYSCVSGVTLIAGPSFVNQYRNSDISELFRHAVDEAENEYKRKHLVAALYHL